MPLRLASFALCTAMLALVAATPADGARARYYLSLGDSLAQGMQPDAAGLTVDTDQGYADQLYAIEKARIRGLRLEARVRWRDHDQLPHRPGQLRRRPPARLRHGGRLADDGGGRVP